MYIAGRTEEDEVVFWNGYTWTYDSSEASEYGSFLGSFEKGQLEANYLEEPRRTWNGLYIVRIYDIS